MSVGGVGMEMESPVRLMDLDEEIKMLEEYRDALKMRLEKVNKRLEGLKR
jgi:predicted metal-binding protein